MVVTLCAYFGLDTGNARLILRMAISRLAEEESVGFNYFKPSSMTPTSAVLPSSPPHWHLPTPLSHTPDWTHKRWSLFHICLNIYDFPPIYLNGSLHTSGDLLLIVYVLWIIHQTYYGCFPADFPHILPAFPVIVHTLNCFMTEFLNKMDSVMRSDHAIAVLTRAKKKKVWTKVTMK